jgi:hypothetical protein
MTVLAKGCSYPITNALCSLGYGPYCTACELEAVCPKPDEQKCRVCGCTWEHACPGGCYWVEPDLCSQCAGMPEVAS